jgi:hypothetical protein
MNQSIREIANSVIDFLEGSNTQEEEMPSLMEWEPSGWDILTTNPNLSNDFIMPNERSECYSA